MDLSLEKYIYTQIANQAFFHPDCLPDALNQVHVFSPSKCVFSHTLAFIFIKTKEESAVNAQNT